MASTATLEDGSRSARVRQRIVGLNVVQVLKGVVKDPVAAIALGVLVVMALLAIAAPVIAPYDPAEIDAFNTLAGSSSEHWLGTDENGRDTLSRLLYGGRISLVVGFISVGIGVLIGLPLGLIAGYFGRLVDAAIMRLIDTIIAFPAIILALAIIAVLGTGMYQLMIAIGITSIPIYSRLVRADVLSLKQQDFVTAARAVGVPVHRILLRHILPNAMAPIIVAASLGLAVAILAEAGLSFLGLGVQPPTPSWGGMLRRALERLNQAPGLAIYPGVAIFLAVLALNIVGDALRDVLDPRLRGER